MPVTPLRSGLKAALSLIAIGCADSGAPSGDTTPAELPIEDKPRYLDESLDLIPLEPGTFWMFTDRDAPNSYSTAYIWGSQVQLTHDFAIGTTEVTQGELTEWLGESPSLFPDCGPDCPVDYPTWHQAAAVANRVSEAAGLPCCYACEGEGFDRICEPTGSPYDCRGYRLPTEAEWEYAARAGSDEVFPGLGDLTYSLDCREEAEFTSGGSLSDYAWHCWNAAFTPHPVGELRSNAWGLHDTLGNVWEWCHDVYDREPHYSTFAMLGVDPEDILTVDPYGPEEGDTRVLKGAGWDSMARLTSPGERLELAPYDHLRTAGFRLARTMY